MSTKKFQHIRCGHVVDRAERSTDDYFAACLHCDEDVYKFECEASERNDMKTITITVGHNIGTVGDMLHPLVLKHLRQALEIIIRRHTQGYVIETGLLTGGDEPATVAYAYPGNSGAWVAMDGLRAELFTLSLALGQDCIGLTAGSTEFAGPRPWA